MSTLALLTFAGGGLAMHGLTLALSIHLPRYFATHVGVSLAAVGTAFTLVRLIDIAFDPAIGMIMDRTKTRIGRYRAWFILGAPILMLSAYMLFMAPKGASQFYLVVWLLIFYSGTSIAGLAHAAWAGTLSNDYNERSRIFGFVQSIALLGSVLVLTVPFVASSFLADQDVGGLHAMGWSMIVLMPILTLLAARTPEKLAPIAKNDGVKLSEYWQIISSPAMRRVIIADLALALGPGTLTPIFIFYWRDARGFTIPQANIMLIIFMAAGLVGAPVWARIAQKLGKHPTIMLSATCFVLTQVVTVNLPAGSPAVFGCMFFLGFFVAAFTLLIRAVVADIADEVRLSFGKERSGLLYALVTSTQKVGGAISVAITFWILAWVGYVPTAGPANTAENLRGLELCYALAPIIFTLIGVVTFIGYPLGAKRHAEIREALAQRDGVLEEAAKAGVPVGLAEVTPAATPDNPPEGAPAR
jgi:Na+/melibiose symporter-like transporter